MIAQLRGILLENNADGSVVLDVNGVGYELLTPLSTQEKLPPLMKEALLYTSLVVREDDMTLYGFATREEKRVFRTIVNSVKGFGPRLALTTLSAMPIAQLCQAIAQEDIKTLSRINGVGKKSAAQLVLDLKSHLAEFGAAAQAPGVPANGVPGASQGELPVCAQDAVKALETLGYRHDDARKAVEAVLEEAAGEEIPSATIIRRALSRFRS
jgi:holliday junction DNA helicase RuvA